MIEKIIIHSTPYGSIRVWFYYKEDDFCKVCESDKFAVMRFMSIWGNYDKRENGFVSFELPESAAAWLKEKFGHYNSASTVEIEL